MKKLVLSVLITLSGCSLLPRAYYRGQPVELNPLSHEEICRIELPIVVESQEGKNISSPPTPNSVSSGQDGKCTTKIRINGKEQEVDSKEIVWRWL